MTARLLAVVMLLALSIAPAAAQDASPKTPVVSDTMSQRMLACVACHGKEGRATNQGYFPRIAGKPEGYLYNQLRNFRDGRRTYSTMNHLTQLMSDDYLRDIAHYFAELDLPYPPAQAIDLDASRQALARQLVATGDPARGIPACIACHGDKMAGRLPAMPGLLTLPADYLLGQFGAWRAGIRKAAPPDCMAEVVRRLTPEEIGAVARWLSAQTLPDGTKPQPRSDVPLPMSCGSLTQ